MNLFISQLTKLYPQKMKTLPCFNTCSQRFIDPFYLDINSSFLVIYFLLFVHLSVNLLVCLSVYVCLSTFHMFGLFSITTRDQFNKALFGERGSMLYKGKALSFSGLLWTYSIAKVRKQDGDRYEKYFI